MGKSKEQKQMEAQRQKTIDMTSRMVNERAFQPSPLEGEASNYFGELRNYANQANQRSFQDYGDMMGGYRDMFKEVSGRQPTSFNWSRVNVERPEELNKALAGYGEFAETGGYSPTDIQELRARGINPIRSAYGNTIRELSRANTLGGGAANYIAARSRAQRELPQQMADAMTGVNANLAQQIREGKLAGLAGMGGLSSEEAGRILQANLANSQGQLQASGMTESAYNNWINNRTGLLNAQGNLYGTTPGMASMFGNQAMQGMGLRGQLEANRNNTGLGLIESNLSALNQGQQNQGQPWWKTALGIAGTAAPYLGFLSDKNAKEDIKPLDSKRIAKGLKRLNLHRWKYKGDNTEHIGPMAQDFKKHLGIGDGQSINLIDVAGVMMAAAKESVARA